MHIVVSYFPSPALDGTGTVTVGFFSQRVVGVGACQCICSDTTHNDGKCVFVDTTTMWDMIAGKLWLEIFGGLK